MRWTPFLVIVVVGCGGEPEAEKLTRVSVLRLDRARSCYEVLTPAQIPDSALGLDEQLCSDVLTGAGTFAGAPGNGGGTNAEGDANGVSAAGGQPSNSTSTFALVAGVDRVRVIVDYGPNIDFSPSATIPTPTIGVLVDGQPASVNVQLSSPQRGTDERVYFIAEFAAPSALTRNLTISASVDSSFQWQVPVVFETRSVAPALSVLRRTSDASGTCYEDLTAAERSVDAALLQPDYEVCSEGAADTHLLAGIDQLLLVADYGPTLSFDSVAAAPVPLFSFLVDGATVGTEATPVARASSIPVPGRVYFTAEVAAPATLSERLRVRMRSANGAGFSVTSNTEFSTGLLTPAFTLLKWKSEQKCYANLADAEVPIEPSFARAIGNICEGAVSEAITAGIDRLAVLIDYGPEVRFLKPADVPTPSPSLVLDGQPSNTAIQLGPARVTDEGRAYYLAATRAPGAPAEDVVLSLTSPPGFTAQLATHFSIVPVKPQIEVLGCTPDACSMVAGTSDATVLVTVPGPQARSVTIRTRLEDAGREVLTSTTLDTVVVDDHSEGRTTLRVPEAGQGAKWSIDAVLAGQVDPGPVITLRAPTVTATLDCEAPCVLATGDSVALSIVAPADIHAAQAFVTQRLDGAVLGATIPVDLLDVDRATQTRQGLIQLTAPAKPGNWRLDVSVNGYRAQPPMATVQSPPEEPTNEDEEPGSEDEEPASED